MINMSRLFLHSANPVLPQIEAVSNLKMWLEQLNNPTIINAVCQTYNSTWLPFVK